MWIERFLLKLKDGVETIRRLDQFTLNYIFSLIVSLLHNSQRKNYNVLINTIGKLIENKDRIKRQVYEITMDDLETILQNFKV